MVSELSEFGGEVKLSESDKVPESNKASEPDKGSAAGKYAEQVGNSDQATNGNGVSTSWDSIRQLRARIRALLKAISNSLPDRRIPTAKMLNRRVKKLVALIELLDDFERDCPKVDWTKANDLVEIYCTGDKLSTDK